MISLEARILDVRPYFIEKTIDEVCDTDFNLISTARDEDYKFGRLSGYRFYSALELDGSFDENKLLFKIEYNDALDNGVLKTSVVNNTKYLEIDKTVSIVLKTDISLPQAEIDAHTRTTRFRVEYSSLMRKRRAQNVFNMVAKNVNTSIESSVNTLYAHYSNVGGVDVISEYINQGSDTFMNAVNMESDNAILLLLAEKMIIGYDGVIGASSGTTPIYYAILINGVMTELTLKEIILNTISYWK